jgi:hypothetical protein
MHYANGRPAKNGDHIIVIPSGDYQKPLIGILYDAVAGNDSCNGRLAARSDFPCTNLAECLHVDDLKAAIGDIKQVKDTTVQPTP